ncbi:MAG: hypothetical protein H0V01_02025 [Bacteroidetes bacterium]|nr:hypothetical protein [Bacteroidota bacterium]HET6245272.1 hypothetical protein [Bacteroidia bacterium]
MDLGSAIIGAILIAICIVPFILMSRGRKKREKQILQSLTDIAVQHNCQISQHEFCGDFVIGIDEAKNFVFFHKQRKDRVIEQFIDLAKIQNCKVINSNQTITNKDGNYKVIDKLELSFIPIAKEKTEITLEFFNSDVSL